MRLIFWSTNRKSLYVWWRKSRVKSPFQVTWKQNGAVREKALFRTFSRESPSVFVIIENRSHDVHRYIICCTWKSSKFYLCYSDWTSKVGPEEEKLDGATLTGVTLSWNFVYNFRLKIRYTCTVTLILRIQYFSFIHSTEYIAVLKVFFYYVPISRPPWDKP